MLGPLLGALVKMKMIGYRDDKFTQLTGFSHEARINPESYSVDYSVELNKEQPPGQSGLAAPYLGSKPRKLSFDVVFDGTGALDEVPGLSSPLVGITDQVVQFKQTVYDYVGGSHRTPFVRLQWGRLLFNCQIESMNMSYRLFSPQAVPLRASAKVVFQEVIADDLLTRLTNPLSADLTHLRTVQAGDTLPLLCHQVYGDATLYPKVALANRLVNFRRLQVGQQLAFPPLVPADEAA